MSPILFTIGSFNVYAFGFFLALSFILSTFIVWKYAKDELKEEEYLDAFLYTSLSSLFVARLTYIIFNFSEFRWNILRYIVVRETPGISLLGGFVGGGIFLYWYCKKNNLDFIHLLDLFSVATSFALFFAKIGEQLGGAGFGKITDFILSVQIIGVRGKHHPVELYEAVLFLFLGIGLTFIYRKIKKDKWTEGISFLLFALFSSLIIFFLEFLKERQIYLYGLSFRQIISLFVFIAAVCLLSKRSGVAKIIREKISLSFIRLSKKEKKE